MQILYFGKKTRKVLKNHEKGDRIIVTQNIGGAFYEKRTEETEGATC